MTRLPRRRDSLQRGAFAGQSTASSKRLDSQVSLIGGLSTYSSTPGDAAAACRVHHVARALPRPTADSVEEEVADGHRVQCPALVPEAVRMTKLGLVDGPGIDGDDRSHLILRTIGRLPGGLGTRRLHARTVPSRNSSLRWIRVRPIAMEYSEEHRRACLRHSRPCFRLRCMVLVARS